MVFPWLEEVAAQSNFPKALRAPNRVEESTSKYGQEFGLICQIGCQCNMWPELINLEAHLLLDRFIMHLVDIEHVQSQLVTTLGQTHTTTPPHIQRLNEQVIGVYLLNSGIPKEDVGEGLLITMENH